MGGEGTLAAGVEDRGRAVRRVERELARLDGLIARARFRRRLWRAVRGGVGAGATLLILLKAKVAASLGLKLAIAAAVGFGLAWPVAVLGLVFLIGAVLAIVSLVTGEDGVSGSDFDWPCDCQGGRERLKRLKGLIAQRRAWLAAPSGPAPSVRWDAAGRRRVAEGRRRNRG